MNLILRLLSAPRLWHALVLWGSFWLLVPMVDRATLFDLVNALSCAIGVGVCVAYMPGVIDGARQKKLSSGDLLIAGIVTAWMATVFRHSWSWLWRLLDRPDGWLDSPWLAFSVYIIATGGALHLWAKDEPIENRFPTRNWARVGIWVAIGLFAAFVVIFWVSPYTAGPSFGTTPQPGR